MYQKLNSTVVEKCNCDCKKVKHERRHFELYKGEVRKYKGDLKGNRIDFHKYLGLSSLLYILHDFFIRFHSNIFFSLISILMLIVRDFFFTRGIIILVAVSFVLITISNIYLDFGRRRQGKEINKKIAKRFNISTSSEEEVEYQNIRVGDILMIRKKEECPADAVILDCSDSRCMAVTQFLNGIMNPSLKKPLPSTSTGRSSHEKGKFKEYRKILTGRIEYDLPNSAPDAFHGYLKLKKDPKGDNITVENVIWRGSVLNYSEWLMVLVIYTGPDSKCFHSTFFRALKANSITSTHNLFTYYTLAHILIYSVVCYVFSVTSRKEVLDIDDPSIKIMGFICLYSPMLPITYPLIYSAGLLLVKRVWSSKIRKNEDPFFKINDIHALPSLGKIDCVFVDKTGTLTTRKTEIISLLIDSQIYVFGTNTKKMTTGYLNKYSTINKKHAKEGSLIKTDVKLQEKSRNFRPQEDRDPPEDISLLNLQFPDEEVNQNDNDIESHYNFCFSPGKNQEFTVQSSRRPLKKDDYLNREPSFVENIKQSMIKESLTSASLMANIQDAKLFNAKVESEDNSIDQALKAIILCQQTKTILDKENRYEYEFLFPEDEVLFEFCSKYNYRFERPFRINNDVEYSINVREKKSKFRVIGINDFTRNRQRFSIVLRDVRESQLSGGVLYVKGFFASMIDCLGLDDFEKDYLQELEATQIKMGNRVLVYAFKHLNKMETIEYEKKLIRLKTNISVQSEEALEEFYFEMEKNLELLAMVCIEDKVKEDAISTFNAIKRGKLKLFMVTGDHSYPTLSTAHLSDLINEDSRILRFKGATLEDCRASMRIQMAELKEGLLEMQYNQAESTFRRTLTLKKSPSDKSLNKSLSVLDRKCSDIFELNYCPLIDGCTLDFILKDQNLRANFAFVLSYSSAMVAYQVSPLQKAALVCLMKQNLLGDPCILAIGDGLNDILMMQAADVSIEITGKDVKPLHAADLRVSKWSLIHRLIFVKGFQLFEKLNTTNYIMYNKSLLIMSFVFFYNWYSNFQITSYFPFYLIFLFFVILTPVSILLKLVYGEQTDSYSLTNNPLIYKENQLNFKRRTTLFLFESIMIPYILSIMTYYLTNYHQTGAYDPNGTPINLEMFYLTTFVLSLILFHIQIIIFVNHNFKTTLTICGFLSIALCLLIILTGKNSILAETDHLSATKDFFKNPGALISSILVLTLCVQCEYIIKEFIYPRLFPSLRDSFLEQTMTVSLSRGDEQLKLKSLERKLMPMSSVSDVAKHIFKNAKMDVSIQELIDPSLASFNEYGYNVSTLEFKDSNLEKKFQRLNQKRNLNFVRIVFVLFFLAFFVYTISNMVQSSPSTNFLKWARFIGLGILACFCFFSINERMQAYYKFTLVLFICLVSLWKIIFDYLDTKPYFIISGCLLLISINHFMIGPLPLIILSSMILIGEWIRTITYFTSDFFKEVENLEGNSVDLILYLRTANIILILGLYVYSNYHQYKFELIRRAEFLTKTMIELQANKINDVLSILVPKFVKDQMDHGVYSMSEDQGEVVIIFCDICKFDKIVENEKSGVVEILDNLFRSFDQLCLQHGIQKIETVGKTYMAASGIRACEIGLPAQILHVEKTKRALLLALDMLQLASNQTWGLDGEPLIIKIGIHIGRVIAGVIGHHKPQFSLIGDTVNTTSRVCSTGMEGAVTLSNEAYQKVKGEYLYFKKIVVNAKGKGSLDTFQVSRTPIEGNKLQTQKSREISKGLVANKLLAIRKREKALNDARKKTFIINSKSKISSPLLLPQQSREIPRKSKFEPNNLNLTPGKDNSNRKSVQRNESSIADEQKSESPTRRASKVPDHWNFLKNIQGRKKSLAVDSEMAELRNKEELSGNQIKPKSSEMLESVYKIDEDIDEDEIEKDLNEYLDERIKQEILVPSKFLLLFDKNYNDPSLISEFFHELITRYESETKFYIFLLSFIYLTKTVLVIIIKDFVKYGLLCILYRGFFSLILMSLYFFKNWLMRKKIYKPAIILIFGYGMCTTLILAYNYKVPKLDLLELTEACLIFYIFTMMSGIFLVECVILLVLVILLWIGIYQALGKLNFDNIFSFLVFCLFCLTHTYKRIKMHVKNFNSIRVRDFKKTQQNELLKHLVPQHILHKFLLNPNKKQDLTDTLSSATMLFADIAGFTKYSSSVSPEQVVTMLKDLFTEFDRQCLKQRVYKVYTIGDCYVVLGVLDAYKRDPGEEARNVLQMGFSMIEIIKQVRTRINFQELDMRIGIHTGEIIGGIIGTDIVRYDIYGLDVMIANKMESNGLEGHVMVSEDTKILLEKRYPGEFTFIKHKTVQLPGERFKDGFLVSQEEISNSVF